MHGPRGTSSSHIADMSTMRFGHGLTTDSRNIQMRDREKRLLRVIEPQKRDLRSYLVNFELYFVRGPLASPTFYVLLITYASIASGCAVTESASAPLFTRVCSGPGANWHSWSNYFPHMLNLLTAFLIVFYLNHCFVRYQVCIDICHDLKKAVTDVMILAIGTIGNRPHATAVLMEFWRTLNLVHITAYESKDSTGLFSFRNFVLPTASAFGYEEFGMLTRAEVEQIEGFAGNRRSGSLYHYLLFSRLYRLAQTAIAEQYTSAAWPVWQSALAPLREASERLMHHATFRVPEIYVMCVGCVAFFTLWVDFFMLATGVGNSFRAQTLEDNKLCNSASGNGDCTSVNNQFGVLVCALTSLLVFATASLVEIILKAAHE